MTVSVGSVCSGIEAASAAWAPLGFDFKWFSETARFPSMLLNERYPDIPNLGDMNDLPGRIASGEVDAPDIICGGTPCQAFSLAGLQRGLLDERGNLTLRFVDIAEQSDRIRLAYGRPRSLVFWENVEGVLSDRTNAFGCFISSLAGLSEVFPMQKTWPRAGFLCGPQRAVAWRVLDAKYFGVPQQRRRLYVIAGDPAVHPEWILFEKHDACAETPDYDTECPPPFEKDGHSFEVFRAYTDCLFSSYATKWNGNASACNGSLFVVQDGRIRRFSPLECERLMGFPDGYTQIRGARKSNRYQALGNSWAVPVVVRIGERAVEVLSGNSDFFLPDLSGENPGYYFFTERYTALPGGVTINCSERPENIRIGSLQQIVSSEDVPDIYLSPAGCAGIIRRSRERRTRLNPRLSAILLERAGETH